MAKKTLEITIRLTVVTEDDMTADEIYSAIEEDSELAFADFYFDNEDDQEVFFTVTEMEHIVKTPS